MYRWGRQTSLLIKMSTQKYQKKGVGDVWKNATGDSDVFNTK